MKIGISIKLDVTKIDKSRIFEGKKGKYLDLTTFIDTEALDEYGNNGFISQSVSKDERAQGVKTPILGNAKVFYQDGHNQAKSDGYQPQGGADERNPPQGGVFDDDIPFTSRHYLEG